VFDVAGYLNYEDYKSQIFDQLGNRINNYIVEKYFRNGDQWDLADTIKTHSGWCYVIDDRCYFECNGSLVPLNMDFESKTCGIAYKIKAKDQTEYVTITGNEYLCESEYLRLRLRKQTYSNGTCFYSLLDHHGDFRIDHGCDNLSELIGVLRMENDIDKRYIGSLPVEEAISERAKLIEKMKQFV